MTRRTGPLAGSDCVETAGACSNVNPGTQTCGLGPCQVLTSLAPTFSAVGAFALDASSRDAALLTTLPAAADASAFARTLVGDTELRPARGQLCVLPPQPEVDYTLYHGPFYYMVPREDGKKFAFQSYVNPDLCVSCGICAASCAPMGVGPPGRTGRDQLAHRVDVGIDGVILDAVQLAELDLLLDGRRQCPVLGGGGDGAGAVAGPGQRPSLFAQAHVVFFGAGKVL